jgi:beta-1,4-mannosyltransferase
VQRAIAWKLLGGADRSLPVVGRPASRAAARTRRDAAYAVGAAIVKIIALPKHGIAYNESFYRAIEADGTVVVDGEFGRRWIIRNVERGDVVHLHWPSFSYVYQTSRTLQLIWFLRFVLMLILIRARGGRLMWTAHNVLPHERSVFRWMDVVARHIVIGLSDAVFVHGREAAGIVGRRFPRSRAKLRQIPHGNWIDYYPKRGDRSTARQELGIPDRTYAYLFIGLCKPYKNLEELLRAFREVDGDCVLLVAGAFPDPAYFRQIEMLAHEDSRVKLFPGFVPDDRIHVYLQACDAVVVPYREVLTSGTAMLALSFGRPVLSVDRGFLRDVINSEVGMLFATADRSALVGTLRAARDRQFSADIIMAHARKYTFAAAAKAFKDTIRERSR